MKQINFLLIFGFGLTTVFFTLENTDQTTVHILPGITGSLPLAALLLIVAGFGAFTAWFFASWSRMLANRSNREAELNQTRINEIDTESDFSTSPNRSRFNVIPAWEKIKKVDSSDSRAA